MLVVRNTLLSRRRADLSQFAAVDTFALVDAASVAFSICVLFIQRGRVLALLKQRWQTSLGLLLLCHMVFILSSLWSTVPAYSAFRAAEMLVEILAVLAALSYVPGFICCERRMLGVSISIVLLIVAGQLRNGVSLTALHTNWYSACAAMLCCYCAAEFPRAAGTRRKRLARYGVASLLLVGLGTSAGSNVALACGLLALLACSCRMGWMLLALPAAMPLLVLIPAGLEDAARAAGQLLFPWRSAQDVASMGGRRALWDYMLTRASERPFLGYGFAGSSYTNAFVAQSSEHNIILAALLAAGAIGLILLLAWLFILIYEMLRADRNHTPGARGCLAATVAAMVNCMSAPFLCVSYSPPVVVFSSILALQAFWTLQRPRMRAASARADAGSPPREARSLSPNSLRELRPGRGRF